MWCNMNKQPWPSGSGLHDCWVCVCCGSAQMEATVMYNSSSLPLWCGFVPACTFWSHVLSCQTKRVRLDCFCFCCRAKGFQHQRMTNGAMNVEIGNPAYKIYEGEPDDDAGELLDADFTLDPDKVETNIKHIYFQLLLHFLLIFVFFFTFLAHQLYKPSVCYPIHGSSQQSQLAGQHRWEEGAAVTRRRGAACWPARLKTNQNILFSNPPFFLPFEEKQNN